MSESTDMIGHPYSSKSEGFFYCFICAESEHSCIQVIVQNQSFPPKFTRTPPHSCHIKYKAVLDADQSVCVAFGDLLSKQ